MLLTILIATFISGVLSLIGAFALSRQSKWQHTFSVPLTAFAAGVMLTTALTHIAPEAVEQVEEPHTVFLYMLIAILLFFLFERLVLWFHHHHESTALKPTAWLVTTGDSIHNFVDGVAIASAFFVSMDLGILTTIAVGLHEIPQEIADFIVLVKSGMSVKRTLILNFLSALTAIAGAVISYLLRDSVEMVIPYILAITAGMFLYIALSDLIPELHEHKHTEQKWPQIIWLLAGVFLIMSVTAVLSAVGLHE